MCVMYEEGIGRVGSLLFDGQTQLIEDNQALCRSESIDEFQENVFGVENRFPGMRIDQGTAGEAYVW
ncbi:hypothetical protein D3C71_1426440 [compost metagenome]